MACTPSCTCTRCAEPCTRRTRRLFQRCVDVRRLDRQSSLRCALTAAAHWFVLQEGEAQVLHVQCKPLAYFTRARDFVVLRVWTMVSGREGVVLSRSVEHPACPPDPEVRMRLTRCSHSDSSHSGVVTAE